MDGVRRPTVPASERLARGSPVDHRRSVVAAEACRKRTVQMSHRHQRQPWPPLNAAGAAAPFHRNLTQQCGQDDRSACTWREHARDTQGTKTTTPVRRRGHPQRQAASQSYPVQLAHRGWYPRSHRPSTPRCRVLHPPRHPPRRRSRHRPAENVTCVQEPSQQAASF